MAVFVVTYNPSRWNWGKQRQQWERRTAGGRSVEGRWSIGSRTSGITPEQDRAFLLKQGPEPRGIIGSGTFVSAAYKDDHWDVNRPGELANYANIRWDTILSDDDLLPVADIEAQVPGLPWSVGIQGSGVILPPPGDAALERFWARHVGTGPAKSDGGGTPSGSRKGKVVQAWQTDPVRRKAVEDYAQHLLEQHYRDKRWKVEDLRYGNPFDAKATKGTQVRYLEAKGTETDGKSVIVSKGEVNFARKHPGECVLGILSGIRFNADGSLDDRSGHLDIHPWDPDTGVLEPTRFNWSPPRRDHLPGQDPYLGGGWAGRDVRS